MESQLTIRQADSPFVQAVTSWVIGNEDRSLATLTTDGHKSATYALTGPQSLTQGDQLKTIGAAIGKELTYCTITPEQFTGQPARTLAQWANDHTSDFI